MAGVSCDIDINLVCNLCGTILHWVQKDQPWSNDPVLRVEPCKKCSPGNIPYLRKIAELESSRPNLALVDHDQAGICEYGGCENKAVRYIMLASGAVYLCRKHSAEQLHQADADQKCSECGYAHEPGGNTCCSK